MREDVVADVAGVAGEPVTVIVVVAYTVVFGAELQPAISNGIRGSEVVNQLLK